jgi:sigma-B regulation protein RsbQ
MVFAHGFGCDQNMWRFVAPAFMEDYRVVLFDYVGSGLSDVSCWDPQRYDRLDGYALDPLEVCTGHDLSDVILVGHSVSSMIAILAANQQPERFSELILIGPSPCYINEPGYVGGFDRSDLDGLFEMMDRNFVGWANYLAPAIMKNAERPELAGELTESFCSTDPLMARTFAAATFYSDNRADLDAVSVPSLILQCSDDVVAPTEVGSYVHRHLRDSTLHVLDATGHCPHMSHPAETIAAMRAYLSSRPSG